MSDSRKSAIGRAVTKRAAGLKFPKLFVLVLLLFLVDFLVPDFIPMLDEMILGLLALMLGMWRDRERTVVETQNA